MLRFRLERKGRVRQAGFGMSRLRVLCQGAVLHGRQGFVGQRGVWSCVVMRGEVKQDRRVLLRCGRLGSAGMVRRGIAWLGESMCGEACYGLAVKAWRVGFCRG